MTRYIQRHNGIKRLEHWSHTIATIMLILSGLVVFVPAISSAVSQSTIQGVRLGHRFFAVIFIAVPIVTTLMHPKNLAHQLKHLFAKWDADDWKFMKLFLPYLFAPKKVHMPKQHATKSGQRLADGMLVFSATLLSLSGVVLWLGDSVPAGIFRGCLLVHDIAFFLIVLVGMAHAYLGSGIFQPYRRSARLMFGDGLVSESDALYHWGYWAEEELASGKNVVEK